MIEVQASSAEESGCHVSGPVSCADETALSGNVSLRAPASAALHLPVPLPARFRAPDARGAFPPLRQGRHRLADLPGALSWLPTERRSLPPFVVAKRLPGYVPYAAGHAPSCSRGCCASCLLAIPTMRASARHGSHAWKTGAWSKCRERPSRRCRALRCTSRERSWVLLHADRNVLAAANESTAAPSPAAEALTFVMEQLYAETSEHLNTVLSARETADLGELDLRAGGCRVGAGVGATAAGGSDCPSAASASAPQPLQRPTPSRERARVS